MLLITVKKILRALQITPSSRQIEKRYRQIDSHSQFYITINIDSVAPTPSVAAIIFSFDRAYDRPVAVVGFTVVRTVVQSILS